MQLRGEHRTKIDRCRGDEPCRPSLRGKRRKSEPKYEHAHEVDDHGELEHADKGGEGVRRHPLSTQTAGDDLSGSGLHEPYEDDEPEPQKTARVAEKRHDFFSEYRFPSGLGATKERSAEGRHGKELPASARMFLKNFPEYEVVSSQQEESVCKYRQERKEVERIEKCGRTAPDPRKIDGHCGKMRREDVELVDDGRKIRYGHIDRTSLKKADEVDGGHPLPDEREFPEKKDGDQCDKIPRRRK